MDDKMKKRIEEMAYRTWETIGGNILTVLAEQNMPEMMTREEVIESVCDASYMKTHGRDEVAYAFWNQLPTYKEKLDAVRGAFPCETYGW